MTEGLKQIDRLLSSLDEVEKWEKFYKENNPKEDSPIVGVSAMCFFDDISTNRIRQQLGFVKQHAFINIDLLIKKQQSLINKLKKK